MLPAKPPRVWFVRCGDEVTRHLQLAVPRSRAASATMPGEQGDSRAPGSMQLIDREQSSVLTRVSTKGHTGLLS